MTGATGYLGRALCARLRDEGHELRAWVRAPERARAALGASVELVAVADGQPALEGALADADAIVHLAGEPLVAARWTAARRRVLIDSRVEPLRLIGRALAGAPERPRVLVSSSAVGIYGDRGDELLDESSATGSGFAAELCKAWEAAAQSLANERTRVTVLRTGVVLGPGGGALAKMLGPFRLGVGGPVGSGGQWMSWLHLDDLVAVWATALTDERYAGTIAAVAPEPVTSKTFARALGRALHRPAVMPVPGLALRALYGEGASLLIEGQRVVPARLQALGFPFRYPTLAEALAASL